MDTRLELFKKKQLSILPKNKKLKESDLKRIIKYTDNCLFGDKCSLWKGYITNNKNKYINFYFNGNKIALHRLLYLNFVGHIYDNIYLSYKCNNQGYCCNINHITIKKNKKKKDIKKNTVEFDF